jgi:hypothetical protein
MTTLKRPKLGFRDAMEIQPDPCTEKKWRARVKLAGVLAKHFDVDGVFFDAKWHDRRSPNSAKGKAVKGYLYYDRKGRFNHGWTVWSSTRTKVTKITESEWPVAAGSLPDLSQIRLVKTFYSSYLVFFGA